MNLLPMLAATGGGSAPTYVDDVFSAYTYTGNGGTTTVANGVDVKNQGGLVWCKNRTSAYSHYLADTARGIGNKLVSDSTAAQAVDGTIDLPTSSGFRLSGGGAGTINESGQNFISWTFRKAPKFFDIVTYTGNGANRTIAHSLGQAPGMIIIKRTDSATGWVVYHRSIANTEYLRLDLINGKYAGAATMWNSTTADASVFSLGTNGDVNQSAGTFVAYLFSHDTATDGLIQCGKATTDGSGAATVALGWEPQFVLMKSNDLNAYWQMYDASRGLRASATSPQLHAGTSGAETTNPVMAVNATGFVITQYASTDYYYLAIRRPNKPPTVGTQVYNAIARTGTGAAAAVTGVGFAPDAVWTHERTAVGGRGGVAFDKLRGAAIYTLMNLTNGEVSAATTLTAYNMDGVSVGSDSNSVINTADPWINWFFKRAPGVFDVVCYTGTGVAKTEAHSLGVVPELMIIKCRSAVNNWAVYTSAVGNTSYLYLESASGTLGPSVNAWNNTTPTVSVFSIGAGSFVNTNAATYVAYLFATKAGISKVGNYTGDGTSGQTINCGFTTGARFVMIKRTDSTGDWFVWDSTRGIVAGNDPHLSLNTTAAEVTTNDTIDAHTIGFIVNQLAPTNVNVSAATYIYLAFA